MAQPPYQYVEHTSNQRINVYNPKQCYCFGLFIIKTRVLRIGE